MLVKWPDFFDSPYFVKERNNFHVTKDAPKELVEKMMDFRRKYYHDENVYGEADYKEIKAEEPEWVWALVGNIKEEHEYGENHEIKKGTKQFGPGTKVYLSEGHWGDGYEMINVIGKPRHSRNYIAVVMKRNNIQNFRMQKVYKPAILQRMKENNENGWGGFWDNSQKSRLGIIEYLEFLAPDEAIKEMQLLAEVRNTRIETKRIKNKSKSYKKKKKKRRK